MNFNLKRPCKDCPFTEGGVDLRPGRLDEIVHGLAENDQTAFYCHKTIDYDRHDPETDELEYDGSETVCMGALARTYRDGLGIPVVSRVAILSGELSLDDIEASASTLRRTLSTT